MQVKVLNTGCQIRYTEVSETKLQTKHEMNGGFIFKGGPNLAPLIQTANTQADLGAAQFLPFLELANNKKCHQWSA